MDKNYEIQTAFLDAFGLKVEDHIRSINIHLSASGPPMVTICRYILDPEHAEQIRDIVQRYELRLMEE